MPQEIRSSATRDAGSVSNDARLKEDFKRTEPPDPALNKDYSADLDDSRPDSLERQVKWIDSMHGPDGPVQQDPNVRSKD